MSVSVVRERARRGSCVHPLVEDLGSDGFVEFYLCPRCRAVIVVQGSRRWIVGPTQFKD